MLPSQSYYQSMKCRKSINNVENDLQNLRQKNNQIIKDKEDSLSKKPLSFETAKASEMKTELLKAKEKIRSQENEMSSIEKEKKGLQLKLKETGKGKSINYDSQI